MPNTYNGPQPYGGDSEVGRSHNERLNSDPHGDERARWLSSVSTFRFSPARALQLFSLFLSRVRVRDSSPFNTSECKGARTNADARTKGGWNSRIRRSIRVALSACYRPLLLLRVTRAHVTLFLVPRVRSSHRARARSSAGSDEEASH